MAAGALCKMRLSKVIDVIDHLRLGNPTVAEFLTKKGIPKSTMRMIEISYAGTFSNGYTEISAPNAVFSGVVTPIVVYVISASANDTNVGGTGHVEKVTIIGIDENDLVTSEEVSMNGATQVATTTLWKRIFHAYASEWGSGGSDAAGAITIANTAQEATYLTIAINTNESDGSAVWIPSGKSFGIEYFELTMITAALAKASLLIKASYINVNGGGLDPELDYDIWRTTITSGGVKDNHIHKYTATGEAKITFSETYVSSVEDGLVKIHIGMFG